MKYDNSNPRFTETCVRLKSGINYFYETLHGEGCWRYVFSDSDSGRGFGQWCGTTLASARNQVHEYIAMKEDRLP